MPVIFLSDLHLKPEGDSRRIELLIRFLRSLKGRCDQLFIMGDLFDFFVDFPAVLNFIPAYAPVFTALADLHISGTRLVCFEGNHDFRLGDHHRHFIGAEIVTDDHQELLEGYRCYLAHGDQVNRQDKAYLRLRRFLRSRWFGLLLAVVPSDWVTRLGIFFSRRSRAVTAGRTDDLDAIYRGFARRKWEEGIDVVILGHNHRQDLYEGLVGGRKRLYINLGHWTETKQPYLELTPEGFAFGEASAALREDSTRANVTPLRRRAGGEPV